MLMLRSFILIMALACALPAAAQPAADTPEHTLATAATQLAAIWRPVPPGRMTVATLNTACAGSEDEMAAINAQLPDPMTVDALANVRAENGLVLVPTDENPSVLFLFPNADLGGITAGLATIRLDPSGPGRLFVRDAAGRDSNFELGSAGGHMLMRVRPRGSADVQTYVRCASSL